MAYTKTNWINGQAPALSAENLNKIEEGIYTNDANIAAIRADIVDYVVEQGTSGDWIYRKWNSGKLEAWFNTSVNVAISTGSGSVYFGNTSVSIPAAVGFLSIKYASIEYAGAEGVWTKLTSRSTSALSFAFVSSISRTASDRTVCGYAFGTWR